MDELAAQLSQLGSPVSRTDDDLRSGAGPSRLGAPDNFARGGAESSARGADYMARAANLPFVEDDDSDEETAPAVHGAFLASEPVPRPL